MTGPTARRLRRHRFLGQTVAGAFAAALALGACASDAPEERSFCDYLAEFDGTGGELSELDHEDPAGLAAAADALRDASKAAPDDHMANQVLALAEAFDYLERSADGDDPVGAATKLRSQRPHLIRASTRITVHAENECGITLGQPQS